MNKNSHKKKKWSCPSCSYTIMRTVAWYKWRKKHEGYVKLYKCPECTMSWDEEGWVSSYSVK